MEDIIKVDFLDRENFIIYYISQEVYRTEDRLKLLFKMLNTHLRDCYDYEFSGFYDVNIFSNDGIYVLEFKNIDDYGRSDFNITMMLNCALLYEFYDSDLIKGDKIYYGSKYYVDIVDVLDNIYLFECGKIVFGPDVEEILNIGKLVSL